MTQITFYDVEQVAPINAPTASAAKSPYAALELLDAGFAAFNADYAATVAAFEQSLAELDSLTELIAAGARPTEIRDMIAGAQARLAETASLVANVAEREEQVIAVQKSIVKSLGGAETDDFAALQEGFAAALAEKLDLKPGELELATTDAAKTTAAAIVSKALEGTAAAAAIASAASADAAAAEKAVVIKAVAKANEAASKAAAKAAKALAKAATAEKQGDKAAAALAKAQAKAAKELVKTVEQQKKNIAKAEAKAAQEALDAAKKAAEAEKAAVAEAAKKGADELKKEAAAAKAEAQKQLAEQKAAEKAAAEKAAAEAKAAEKAAAEAEQKALEEVKAAIAAGKDADAAAEAAKPVDAELAAAEKDAASKADEGSTIVNPEIENALKDAIVTPDNAPTEPEKGPEQSKPSGPVDTSYLVRYLDEDVVFKSKADYDKFVAGVKAADSATGPTKDEIDDALGKLAAKDWAVNGIVMVGDLKAVPVEASAEGQTPVMSFVQNVADEGLIPMGKEVFTAVNTFTIAKMVGLDATTVAKIKEAGVKSIGGKAFAEGSPTTTNLKLTFDGDVAVEFVPAGADNALAEGQADKLVMLDAKAASLADAIAAGAVKAGGLDTLSAANSTLSAKLGGSTALTFDAAAKLVAAAALATDSTATALAAAGVTSIAGMSVAFGAANTITVGSEATAAELTFTASATLSDLAGFSGTKTLAELQAAGVSKLKVGSGNKLILITGTPIGVTVNDTSYQVAPEAKLSDFIELLTVISGSFDNTGKPGISKVAADIVVGTESNQIAGTTKLNELGDKLKNGDMATVKDGTTEKGTLAKDVAGNLSWTSNKGGAKIEGLKADATLTDLIAVEHSATWENVKKVLPEAAGSVKIAGQEVAYDGTAKAYTIEGASIANTTTLGYVADYLAGYYAGKIAVLAKVVGVENDGNSATLTNGTLGRSNFELTWAAGTNGDAIAITELDGDAKVADVKQITSKAAKWSDLVAVAKGSASVKIGTPATDKGTVSAIKAKLAGLALKDDASVDAVATFAAENGQTVGNLDAIVDLAANAVAGSNGSIATGKVFTFKEGGLQVALQDSATVAAAKALAESTKIADSSSWISSVGKVSVTSATEGSVKISDGGNPANEATVNVAIADGATIAELAAISAAAGKIAYSHDNTTLTVTPAAEALDLSALAAGTNSWKFSGVDAKTAVSITAPVVAAKALADFTLENWEAKDKLSIGAANASTAEIKTAKDITVESASYKVTAAAAADSAPAVLTIKDGDDNEVTGKSVTDELIEAVAAALDGDSSIAANSVYQVADSAGVYIINVGSTAKDDYTIVHLSGLGTGTLAVAEGALVATGAAAATE